MLGNGIPVSVSLNPTLERENFKPKQPGDRKRLFIISVYAVFIAACISFVARLLVYLIDLFTNISFYGRFSIEPSSPAGNTYGWLVVFVPVIGGVIVGLMAFYGSKAIRGHGIPEAMEQVLTNKSRIKPSITFLKPLSAAISIGTGGPFGAEGPIIATGGAFGSTMGQILKITDSERKILLAAGATAGMSAIFGSPVAAIFLAIELLLFEFSPRSFVPVALACITGAAGHHLLFPSGVVFPMATAILPPSNEALGCYSLMGVLTGLLAVIVTKAVYFIEDMFEKLPIHWMWWPALGGIAVGVVGYFAPRTLGVGYDNITELLSGDVPLRVVVFLFVLKFISWSISLGSGTSGGTLAPLLTIGGAGGALFGILCLGLFPNCGVTVPLAALIGMSALFAGASRAFLTSIIFALETTGQSNALLPLLAACTASYFISYFFMKNSIMTEKIARRGVATPYSYEPDILEKHTVAHVFTDNEPIISEENSVKEIRNWLDEEPEDVPRFLVVTSNEGEYKGIVSFSSLFSRHYAEDTLMGDMVKHSAAHISSADSLRQAVEIMATTQLEVLPVIEKENNQVVGVISYHDIMSVYRKNISERKTRGSHISLKRRGLKILLRGQRWTTINRKEAPE